MDTTKASVPKNYDAHAKSGLVLQAGTEATSQVGQFDSNQQLTNSTLLHEPRNHPGHDLPPTQPYEAPTAQQQDNTKENTQEQESPINRPQSIPTIAERPQDAPSTRSMENQPHPANSTHSIDLGFPMRCNLCDKEVSSKNLFQHC